MLPVVSGSTPLPMMYTSLNAVLLIFKGGGTSSSPSIPCSWSGQCGANIISINLVSDLTFYSATA